MADAPELSIPLLLSAYECGIFPMAETRDSDEVFWLNPLQRGIFPFDKFHISRSLARRMRQGGYEVCFDRDFSGVVRACADRDETWISAPIYDAYCALHAVGHAHSIEVYINDDLVAGVYGVTRGAAFFGESMFSRVTDTSKIALAFLVDHLRRGGFVLFDTQFITPHLASLGAIEVPRAEYLKRLKSALRQNGDFSKPDRATADQVIQRNTQTS